MSEQTQIGRTARGAAEMAIVQLIKDAPAVVEEKSVKVPLAKRRLPRRPKLPPKRQN